MLLRPPSPEHRASAQLRGIDSRRRDTTRAMTTIAAKGPLVATKLQQLIEARCPGIAVTHEDGEPSEGCWSRTIELRQGRWVGVDIELREQDGTTTISTETGSQGAAALMLLAVVVALGLSLSTGDWLLRLIGVNGLATSLTVALGTFPFLFITVPAAMATQSALGRSGAAESQRLLIQVNALVAALEVQAKDEPSPR